MDIDTGSDSPTNSTSSASSAHSISPDDINPHMILYLIRGGHAEHNQGFDTMGERAYYSKKYAFSNLTQEGVNQTKRLSRRIRSSHVTFDRILTSPLDRAMQTAQILFPDREVMVTDDIRGMNYAHTPNKRRNVSILAAAYPKFNYSAMHCDDDILYRYGDTYNRFSSFITYLKATRAQFDNSGIPSVAIVSHESFMLKFATAYLGVKNFDSIQFCEIIKIDIDLSLV